MGGEVDTDGTREETTDPNEEDSNDSFDDSVTVDAYRFGSDN